MKRNPFRFLALLAFTCGFLISSGHSQEKTNSEEDKIKSEIEKAANKLFNQATKKYKDQEYTQSNIDFIMLLDFYPDHPKTDQVVYQLGSGLYEMGMLEGADQMFRYLLKSIPKTPLVPDAILGLQKVYYHKGEFQQSLKFYKALEGHYPAHATIDEARYYAGQAYYNLKNYNVVSNMVQHIKGGSEFYAFSLYTQALTNLKKKV